MAQETAHLEEFAKIFAGVFKRVFGERGATVKLSPPAFVVQTIHEYDGKMRVSGLEKFNASCYISAINFYRSPSDQQKKTACGALIFYIREAGIESAMRWLGYKIDEELPDEIVKTCTEFMGILSTQFRDELKLKGYPELILSPAASARNNFSSVPFSYDQYDKIEMSFMVNKEKIFIVDMTMAQLPH